MRKILLSLTAMLTPLALAATKPAAGDAKAGAKLFGTNCAACHGPKAEGNSAIKAPSLKDAAGWKSALFVRAVHDLKDDKGVALKAPMMKFPQLTDKQILDIQAFVKANAKK